MVNRIRIRRDPTASAPPDIAEPTNMYAVGAYVVVPDAHTGQVLSTLGRVVSVQKDTAEAAISLFVYQVAYVITGAQAGVLIPEHMVGPAPDFLLQAASDHLNSVLDSLQAALDDCEVSSVFSSDPDEAVEDEVGEVGDVEEDARPHPRRRILLDEEYDDVEEGDASDDPIRRASPDGEEEIRLPLRRQARSSTDGYDDDNESPSRHYRG